jgi:hypothetical protein
MISEVLNAIYLTYLATEYRLLSFTTTNTSRPPSTWSILSRPSVLGAGVALTIINVVDRYVGAADVLKQALERFLHVPKIILVAFLYLIGLYMDCRRIDYKLDRGRFLRYLRRAFSQLLPVYPLLAILISFGFLLLINLFEFLKLPLELLNMPIYYGTLYGPFSMIYFNVKRRVLEERTSLPT